MALRPMIRPPSDEADSLRWPPRTRSWHISWILASLGKGELSEVCFADRLQAQHSLPSLSQHVSQDVCSTPVQLDGSKMIGQRDVGRAHDDTHIHFMSTHTQYLRPLCRNAHGVRVARVCVCARKGGPWSVADARRLDRETNGPGFAYP